MSFVILPSDDNYLNQPDDLRVNVSSGVLTLRDGTSGGYPVLDPTYGMPTNLISQTSRPSGIQGWSLQLFMNEFPRYSRISSDMSSVGAQLFMPTSAMFDELVSQSVDTFDSLHLKTYPCYQQGVIYEYSFAGHTDLHSIPAVSGCIGSQWFNLPITKDTNQFWLAPPTRFETTTCEISGVNMVDWTQCNSSGVTTILDENIDLPLYNNPWIYVSGALKFQYNERDTVSDTIFANILIYGRWAHDSLRPDSPIRRERISVTRNGFFRSDYTWRSIHKIETVGLSSDTYIKAEALNFNASYVVSQYAKHFEPIRDDGENFLFYHLVTSGRMFGDITQSPPQNTIDITETSYLVQSFINTDTIFDDDIEFSYFNVWQLADREGMPLSGIVDIAGVPNSNYLLALSCDSKIHVFDTFQPAVSMRGKTQVRESPIHINVSWPATELETPSNYTLNLGASHVSYSSAVPLYRWQWSVEHNNIKYNLNDDGSTYLFNQTSGWITNTSGVIHDINFPCSTAGSYVFELNMVDRNGGQYRTFANHNKTLKRAINTVPINGLSVAPSGLDFDSYSRPWVKMDNSAVRIVMRTDIGTWVPNEQVLITREPYDEVRKS